MTDTQIRPKNYLILYHANCIDGFTSAWAAYYGLTTTKLVKPESIKLIGADYTEKLNLMQAIKDWDIDMIYVVDFSLPFDLLVDLYYDTDVHITMLDHHASAIRKLESIQEATPSFDYTLDITNCGAGLVWKHFFPEKEDPTLIRLVRDYDLWIKSYPETDYINKYLQVQPKTIKTWTQLHYDMQEESLYKDMVRGGLLIQKYHDKLVADTVECARPIYLLDHPGLTVDSTYALVNDVGHILTQKSPTTFGAVTVRQSSGAIKYSLRSEGDFDVASIAEAFGGGGHKTAASFTINLNTPVAGIRYGY